MLLDRNTETENEGMIDEQLEGSSGQIDEGAFGPDYSPVLEWAADAWLSDDHKDTEELRRVLWTQHDLPVIGHFGEEEVCQERMEHEQREAQKSVHVNHRGTEPAQLH